MKNSLTIILCSLLLATACSDTPASADNHPQKPEGAALAEQNLLRAIELADKAVASYFTGAGMTMARYYNPYTGTRSDEKGSIWMYTSSIEAVNAIMDGLKVAKEHGNAALYDAHFQRYSDLLYKLVDNAAYYLGTFTLTSYTQTRSWTVYGVDRGNDKGTAQVESIHNVYDDQQWLVRELLEAYQLTGNAVYLEKAEYLTDYVLDGWDCARDNNGNEYGGIPWGPGYATKHSCSNGPMVSPLVWLHELYKGKADEIAHRDIDPIDKKTRRVQMEKKSDYYLDFAKKVYDWQKKYLLRSDGVYDDLMGGDNSKVNDTETVNGVIYKKHINMDGRGGPAISYNSGTMLSGAADLYRATGSSVYLEDAKKLSDASFKYFAQLDATKPGYYTYDISGFRNWFNGVLMRGYVDVEPSYSNVEVCINSFQQNLDYGYDNFLHEGFLPTNLLVGWSRENNNNRVEGMFTFAFAAEYAILARYELEK